MKFTHSDDLEKYCPMTILEKIWLIWRCLYPFLCAALALVTIVIAVIRFRPLFNPYAANHQTAVILCLVILAASVFALRGLVKFPPAGAIRDMLLRAEGYWLLFTVDPKDDRIQISPPLTTGARNVILKEHTAADGLYFLVSLSGEEDGMIFVGENSPHKETIQRQLGWLKVRPFHLSSYVSELQKVSIRLVDKDGHESFPMSISLAACFIRSAQIGWLNEECNSLRGALAAILNNQKPLPQEDVT
jgi:hypothetical protein